MFYDITQEVFSGRVYPGDTPPSFSRAQDMEKGDGCTVTDIAMCAHNGTHADAPAHFIRGGRTAEEFELSRFAGACAVRSFTGVLRPEMLEGIEAPRLLIKGACIVSEDAAKAMREKFLLVGVEAQTVGSPQVHKILLGAEVAVLEGLALGGVPDGKYELFAFPLKLGGADGAPVRAVLRTLEVET